MNQNHSQTSERKETKNTVEMVPGLKFEISHRCFERTNEAGRLVDKNSNLKPGTVSERLVDKNSNLKPGTVSEEDFE